LSLKFGSCHVGLLLPLLDSIVFLTTSLFSYLSPMISDMLKLLTLLASVRVVVAVSPLSDCEEIAQAEELGCAAVAVLCMLYAHSRKSGRGLAKRVMNRADQDHQDPIA